MKDMMHQPPAVYTHPTSGTQITGDSRKPGLPGENISLEHRKLIMNDSQGVSVGVFITCSTYEANGTCPPCNYERRETENFFTILAVYK